MQNLQFITQSSTNKYWYLQQQDTNNINTINKLYNLTPTIAKILLNRGLGVKDVEAFVNPKLKNLMPNPKILHQLQQGVDLLTTHITNKSNIMLFGDYDVDGITSISVFYKYLQQCAIDCSVFIPNRFTQGYGLNANSLQHVLTQKPNLLILLDNGSGSYNEVKELRQNNIDVIIIDHHALEVTPPQANAIINPKSFADSSNLNYLCTVGLVFLFLVELNNTLHKNNIILNKINLMQFLDLVALGTIADMVPLIGVNRAYASNGIKLLQNSSNVGLQALINAINLDKAIDYDTIGFYLAPLINAGARMGDSQISFNLLNSTNSTQANALALQLSSLNQQRQQQEDITINQAIAEITNNKQINNNSVIMVGSSQWSAGTVGIIAGRLKEIYNKPACVFAIDGNNVATASGRSVDGVDLGELILGARARGLLIKGGGHSQAVGFSFNLQNQQALQDFLNNEVQKKYTTSSLQTNLVIDDVLPVNSINVAFGYKLQTLLPFGINFAEPLFMLNNVQLKQVKQIGQQNNHISCLVTDGFKYYLKAFAFKSLPGILGQTLLTQDNKFVDLAVCIKVNVYQGKEYINLIIKDVVVR